MSKLPKGFFDIDLPKKKTPVDKVKKIIGKKTTILGSGEEKKKKLGGHTRIIYSPQHVERGKLNKGVKKRNRPALTNPVKLTGITLHIGEQKKLNPQWREIFLYRLADTGSVKLACELAEVSRSTVENERRINNWDNDFEKQFQMAKKDFNDSLDFEGTRRGRDGIDEPLTYKGTPTGHFIKRYSDALLEKRMEAEMPDKYRKQGITINNNQLTQNQVVLGFQDDDEGIFSPD